MTEDEQDHMLKAYPRLYHMAEYGSWPSIRAHGLLSTKALLELYDIEGKRYDDIYSSHRPDSVDLEKEGLLRAVVRDQKPMSDKTLEDSLKDGLTPTDWYQLLNNKTFFWLTEKRLRTLLGAKPYRNRQHDVLILDTRSLVEAEHDKIWLSTMNSGASVPFKHPRGLDTFSRIDDYPYAKRLSRSLHSRIVELCVERGVRNIEDHIIEVRRMSVNSDKAAHVHEVIYEGQHR